MQDVDRPGKRKSTKKTKAEDMISSREIHTAAGAGALDVPNSGSSDAAKALKSPGHHRRGKASKSGHAANSEALGEPFLPSKNAVDSRLPVNFGAENDGASAGIASAAAGVDGNLATASQTPMTVIPRQSIDKELQDAKEIIESQKEELEILRGQLGKFLLVHDSRAAAMTDASAEMGASLSLGLHDGHCRGGQVRPTSRSEKLRRWATRVLPVASMEQSTRPCKECQSVSRPLLYAAEHAHLRCVESLISHNEAAASLHRAEADEHGNALHRAARTGVVRIMELLLSGFPGMDGLTAHGRTPVHVAALAGNREVLQVMLGRRPPLEARDVHGLTALDLAASAGHSGCVQLLLQAGADVRGGCGGRMPLHAAAGLGLLGVVETLLAGGVSVAFEDEKKWQVLHHAAAAGREDIVRLVLRRGAYVDATTSDGETAFHLAARNCRLRTISVLVAHHARTNIFDRHGQTALHCMAELGLDEGFRAVCPNSVDLDVSSGDALGRSCLLIAIAHRQIDTAKQIIVLGANVDSQGRDGKSGLHLAAAIGARDIAKELLARGANALAEDVTGEVPADAAWAGDFAELAQLLEAAESIAERGKSADERKGRRRRHGGLRSESSAEDVLKKRVESRMRVDGVMNMFAALDSIPNSSQHNDGRGSETEHRSLAVTKEEATGDKAEQTGTGHVLRQRKEKGFHVENIQAWRDRHRAAARREETVRMIAASSGGMPFANDGQNGEVGTQRGGRLERAGGLRGVMQRVSTALKRVANPQRMRRVPVSECIGEDGLVSPIRAGASEFLGAESGRKVGRLAGVIRRDRVDGQGTIGVVSNRGFIADGDEDENEGFVIRGQPSGGPVFEDGHVEEEALVGRTQTRMQVHVARAGNEADGPGGRRVASLSGERHGGTVFLSEMDLGGMLHVDQMPESAIDNGLVEEVMVHVTPREVLRTDGPGLLLSNGTAKTQGPEFRLNEIVQAIMELPAVENSVLVRERVREGCLYVRGCL
jgi:ankyrin repeat protein